MSVTNSRHWLFMILLTAVPVQASSLDDADERLFRVQLAMAEKGDVRAQYYLGEMHEQGLGTRQNLGEAFKWYEKAAEKGDSWAKRKLVHRAEIEASVKKDQMVENPKTAMVENPKTAPTPRKQKTPETTGKNDRATTTSEVLAKASDAADEVEKIKAAEREKRRAIVRAMILERIRHPVGEPFE